jgi:nucleoside 2-deoxyribosyltransferase
MKLYLAGPDVFLSDAVEIGRCKKDICTRYGQVGLFPLDGGIAGTAIENGPADRSAPPSQQIFRGCIAMMEAADAVIANLTPFRGPSADAGTVYELGYMAARRKLCTGYSNVPGSYSGRIDSVPKTLPDGHAIEVDRDGHEVEDFGLADNLMIVHALDSFGHPLLVPHVAPANRWRDLALFEKCVQWIAGLSIGAPTA